MIVGLNETRYYVNEETGMVTVCVAVMEPTIDCPVSFPFSVTMQTIHDTAGIIDTCQYCLINMLYISHLYRT